MIITIDGPAGTGKSTVAKALAKRLNLKHIDTGAMYRAVTLALLKKSIPLNDLVGIKSVLSQFSLITQTIQDQKRYIMDGLDVTEEIRTPAVTAWVSTVSALAEVRKLMVDLQREQAQGVDVVCEGRDIGTVVFPDAEVKIFLTASPQERAQRRFLELQCKCATTYEEVLQDIEKRDYLDSNRAISPLQPAKDAYILDCSSMSVEKVVEEIVSLYQKAKQ